MTLEEDNSKLDELIIRLTIRLGREPTEEEVHGWIFGDRYTRIKIWNRGVYR